MWSNLLPARQVPVAASIRRVCVPQESSCVQRATAVTKFNRVAEVKVAPPLTALAWKLKACCFTSFTAESHLRLACARHGTDATLIAEPTHVCSVFPGSHWPPCFLLIATLGSDFTVFFSCSTRYILLALYLQPGLICFFILQSRPAQLLLHQSPTHPLR